MYTLRDIPDRLPSPENYMEIEGFDVRLAALKLNDFLETLGDSKIALTYADPEEHPSIKEYELAVIRRIHLRHAVIDLNNCFDLLLQVPWFFYRIWEKFNPGGSLYQRYDGLNNGIDRNTPITIIRNNDGWVEDVEEACSLKKILTYFRTQNVPTIRELKQSLVTFKNTNIFNPSKQFTVRTIANQIKHKHSLKVKETNKPVDFNIDTQYGVINLRSKGIAMKCDVPFFDEGAPNNTLGKINLEFTDDLYLDIEYNSGEKFRAKDYIKNEFIYGLDDIHKEVLKYYTDIIKLYEGVYKIISPHLSFNPLQGPTKYKTATINLDKFFKA